MTRAKLYWRGGPYWRGSKWARRDRNQAAKAAATRYGALPCGIVLSFRLFTRERVNKLRVHGLAWRVIGSRENAHGVRVYTAARYQTPYRAMHRAVEHMVLGLERMERELDELELYGLNTAPPIHNHTRHDAV